MKWLWVVAFVAPTCTVPYNGTAGSPGDNGDNGDRVKPDPPEDLRVSPIPGETKKLLLEWSPPGSWPFPQYFPLKYRIRYAQEGGSVTKTIGPYEQTSYTLTGVPPRTLHHIQVAAKDFTDSGEFSAWSLPASGMPWVEP
ncbi:interleukin-27 subunit beta isoform X3 [Falco naumanni]|uniref:interleukin-27 subunit beta isoform X3 n=1 Tax=Falco naumanni TaxID=148594 RepID=UPI001ADE3CEB|nr:interleukin-27 subunit beta isoform X3 [Falco naumanni]